MTPEQRRQAFRDLAASLDRIDLDVYREYGVDPREPTLGAGDPDARIAVFGRDPGRHEVAHRQPFVGAGGQKIRRELYRAVHGGDLPDFDASLAIGRTVFWANTVPYKPLGNKAWSMKVKRAFLPLVSGLLVHEWRGRDVLCMGREAFFWFGLADRATRQRLQEHWERDDRFEHSIEVSLAAPDGARRTLAVHPLPHPSPLNATWAPHFPGLLASRLATLGFDGTHWRLPSETP